MQQIQEDRAGFAKLRTALAQKNLTPEQYRLALIDSPDPKMQQMGIELGLRQTRLDDLDRDLEKARGGGVEPPMAPAEAPMAAPVEAPMAAPAVVAPGVPYNSFGQTGKYRYDKNLSAANIFELHKKSKQGSIELEPNQYWSQDQNGQLIVKAVPPVVDNALAAQAAPGAPVVNALVAQPAVSNAMAAKQTQIAEINRKLDVLNSPKYSDLPGAKGRINTLERQLKQLTESAFAKPDISNFTPASVAKYGQTGNPGDLVAVGKEGTKSELARLISERAALVASGAALTDNRVVAYDNAITKASAPSAGQPSELTRLIAERKQAKTSGASPQVLANYDAAINKQINFAPPMQVVMPVAVEDPKRPGSVIYVDRSEAIGKTPATAIEGLAPKEIQAREAKYPQALQAVKTLDTKTEGLAKDIETLANHPGLTGISGLIYGRTPAVTKNARAAQALYDSIVARGGFAELQSMRAASPTGGALGNVSNQEGQYLRDAFAAINRTQDTADLKASLLKAAGQARESKARVKEAFDATYDYRANRGKTAAPAVNVDALLDKYK